MNHLGITLAWSTAQVSLVLVPAILLHVLASRRSPVTGSWVAAIGLALVVLLSTSAFVPWPHGATPAPAERPGLTIKSAASQPAVSPATTGHPVETASATDAGRDIGMRIRLADLRGFWGRLERGAAAPAARVRPWGRALAILGLVGTGLGLCRLLLGLWAVRLCRRRGRIVVDPEVISLLHDIRAAMGCRRAVELRAVPGLTTPATAGWRHPVVLLPDDWPSWDEADRRAVLAHELAHIARHDYASGLVARLAVALQFYHPLVRWMAGRLQLQQELAADALGARFAGGRGPYLVALSRLALRQDGRSPSWPARAFLPARGTLIRRIAMLREETLVVDRPWSRSRRLAVGLGLLAVAVGVATLRGPARGDDKPARRDAEQFVLGTIDIKGVERVLRREAPKAELEPIELIHVPEMIHDHGPMVGLVAFRPAATFSHRGMSRYAAMLRDNCVAEAAKGLKVDPSKPGFLKLGLEDIAWLTCGMAIRHGKSQSKDGEKTLYAFMLSGLTVRTVKPFDWLAFLRQWRFEFTEAREGTRVYYKVPGQMGFIIDPHPAVYLPDDRTIVFDTEAMIQQLLRREKRVIPAFLTGPEWERASRGLLAVAINNQDGAFVKKIDLNRPGDAVVLSLFKGVESLVFGVEDRDDFALRATAVCQGDAPRDALVRTVEALIGQGRKYVDQPARPGAHHGQSRQMLIDLLANVQVSKADGRAIFQSTDFGRLTDLAAIMEAESNEWAQNQKDADDRKAARNQKDAETKRVKR